MTRASLRTFKKRAYFSIVFIAIGFIGFGHSAHADTINGNTTNSGAQIPSQASPPPALAESDSQFPDDFGRFTATEENDYFASHDDRHYTQGLRLSYLSRPVTTDGFWDRPFEWLSGAGGLPVFDGGDFKRKWDWELGQSIFTPTNTYRVTPSPLDRPYAAWLYTGPTLLQETNQGSHTTLEDFELLAGVVGPFALGEQTQNDFHQFIGDQSSVGWHDQLKNEPGITVSYDRKWRFELPLAGNFGFDAIPEIGATGGNFLTYAETGGLIRMGQNLKTDYGSSHIRPSLSGTDWFNPEQMKGPLGWYIFAGTQGRAVARNIFLQGNTFTESPGVDAKPLVADLMAGASLFWANDLRVDFTAIQRTKEFYGQQGHPDRFGSIDLAFQFF